MEGVQAAGLGVALADREVVAGVAADEAADEAVGDRRAVRARRAVGQVAGVEAGLHVAHQPRAGAGAPGPRGRGAEVDGLHRADALGRARALGVAVVEAAAAVVVGAVEDHVDALGLIVDGDARGLVVAVPHARDDVDAVGAVAVDRRRRHVRDRQAR